jgi:hypothetical protein
MCLIIRMTNDFVNEVISMLSILRAILCSYPPHNVVQILARCIGRHGKVLQAVHGRLLPVEMRR